MTAVAIIPARGGSKRIPRKNIRPFYGRPAIAWPISALLATKMFSRIVVSTDDAEIAQVARAHGAETPFVRSADLADDMTGTNDVVRDAIARLNLAPETPVCCVYPTALFVTPDLIVQGRARLSAGARWVFCLGEYTTPIDRAFRRVGNRIVPRAPEMMNVRSQDLEPAFFDAGQFYWARAGTWSEPGSGAWDGADGVILPPERAVDIDTPDDWDRAERLMRILSEIEQDTA